MASSDSTPPLLFDHYRVLTNPDGSPVVLGQGGMGTTYKGVDTNLGRDVAIKVIRPDYLQEQTARMRFLREAKSSAKLHHRNIATVFHQGQVGNTCYYAMEFISGKTLQTILKERGRLPAGEALAIVYQAAQGLSEAEKNGLVHRDIKPANLMLKDESDGQSLVKLIDFGLAKAFDDSDGDATNLTSAGGFLGTAMSSSPEQCRGEKTDTRSDIYSLGVVLWCMLEGRPPYQDTNPLRLMMQHLEERIPLKQLVDQPREVVELLETMLAKKPKDRPQTCRELLEKISRAQARISGFETPRGLSTVSGTRLVSAPSNPLVLRLGSVLAVGVLLLGGGYWMLAHRDPRESAPTPGTVQPVGISSQPQPAPLALLPPPAQQAVVPDPVAPPGSVPPAPLPTPSPNAPPPPVVAPAPATGSLSVTVETPAQAREYFALTETWIRIGSGERIKATHWPWRVKAVPIGPTEVSLDAAGFQKVDSLAAVVKADATTSLTFTLQPSPARAQITCGTPGAKLEFADGVTGTVNSFTELSALQATSCLISAPGFTPVRLEIPALQPGQPFQSTVVLQPLPSPPSIPAPVPSPPLPGSGLFVNSLGMRFVPVPITGSERSNRSLLMSIWETRVKDYQTYAEANPSVESHWKERGLLPAPELPVSSVNWEEAHSFCAWLTRRERESGAIQATDEYRLPTDHEWSCAVGIGKLENPADGPNLKDEKIPDTYPWGTEWPPPAKAGNYSSSLTADGFDFASPVGRFPANSLGLFDLGGGVWEWCEDWYDSASKRDRVLRGASWLDSRRNLLLSSYRFGLAPEQRNYYYGFRCVLSREGRKSSP